MMQKSLTIGSLANNADRLTLNALRRHPPMCPGLSLYRSCQTRDGHRTLGSYRRG